MSDILTDDEILDEFPSEADVIKTTVDGREAVIDSHFREANEEPLFREKPSVEELLKRIAVARDRVEEAKEKRAPFDAEVRAAQKALEEAVMAGAVGYWANQQETLF